MTREEKISHLKDILSEINENDDAVCYLTSEDNELIESAIEALEQQPCEDAISREEAIKQCGFGMTSLHIADNLRRLPSVTLQPNTGHWIIRDDLATVRYYQCSECNEIDLEDSDYCPNCGAKMVEPQESEEE